jgi:hypothetical protein
MKIEQAQTGGNYLGVYLMTLGMPSMGAVTALKYHENPTQSSLRNRVNQEVCNIDLKTQGEREGGPEINSKI